MSISERGRCGASRPVRLVLCAMLAALAVAVNARAGERPLIGLVLSSGGCKGAYHLGVWQALCETGLTNRIAALSGTSVGSLCAALFVSLPDPRDQQRAWRETMSLFQIQADKAETERIFEAAAAKKRAWYGVDRLSPKLTAQLRREAEVEARVRRLPRIAQAWNELLADPDATNRLVGVASFDPLVRQLEAILPEPFAPKGPDVYATALCCSRPERRAFHLNALGRPVRQKALCASAAIPIVFPPVEIDGVLWQDGGWVERGGDKTPIDPILENNPDVATVVVVYLLDQAHLPAGGREAIRRKAVARRVRLVEIVPTENIGGDLNGWSGVFDTSEETARHLAALGRQDALTALRALASERDTGGTGALQP